MKWILVLIMVTPVFGKSLYPRKKTAKQHQELAEVITNSIFEELIKETKDMKPPKKFEEEKKSSLNQGRRGRQIIEEMKRRNREKLAKMRGINPDEVKSGADIVKKQKEDNKKLIKEINKKIKNAAEWRELAQSEIEALKKQVISDWKKKHQEMIKKWEAEKKEYNKKKKDYQKTTFKLPLVLPIDKKSREKKVGIKIERDYFIVSNALSVPVRDQKFRPTCSAFAGVRLLEVLLAQHESPKDLSEQYFYWASKDDCQNRTCSKPGSWAGNGYKYSRIQRSTDIPLEKNCPYGKFSKKGNETQIPLNSSCEEGYIKVGDYQYHKTLDEVIETLDSNRAVIASMKLTPNYYTSRSLILYKDRKKGDRMDSHAQGHSMVIVGYVKLPQVLNEGSVCFVVANSWGEGWGKGGYSCISEKWMLKQRQSNPFVSVTYVKN